MSKITATRGLAEVFTEQALATPLREFHRQQLQRRLAYIQHVASKATGANDLHAYCEVRDAFKRLRQCYKLYRREVERM